ncbi:hypothetical protein ACIA5D_37260 [Actinoplanes sp. NPDC051513]|uniref:hypothetical protein n=1 Tax=Actinoplanes sp. NPDC051513 TaxID=3363908 RepID=UPI0037A0F361
MRLPRLLLCGALLYAAVYLLTALFAQPPFDQVGAVAAAVFLPLWLTLSVANAAIGVYSAGYRPREEATVLLPVFGVPAVLALVVWWLTGGAPIASARTPLILIAGIALWLALALLGGLLLPGATRATALRFTAAVFLPLWVALMMVNLLIGVVVAGYGVGEEIPVLLLNVAVPAVVAAGAWAPFRERPTPWNR